MDNKLIKLAEIVENLETLAQTEKSLKVVEFYIEIDVTDIPLSKIMELIEFFNKENIDYSFFSHINKTFITIRIR